MMPWPTTGLLVTDTLGLAWTTLARLAARMAPPTRRGAGRRRLRRNIRVLLELLMVPSLEPRTLRPNTQRRQTDHAIQLGFAWLLRRQRWCARPRSEF
jgi:hypothetical protein